MCVWGCLFSASLCSEVQPDDPTSEFSFFGVLEKCLREKGTDAADALAKKTLERSHRIVAAIQHWRVKTFGEVCIFALGPTGAQRGVKLKLASISWPDLCGPRLGGFLV